MEGKGRKLRGKDGGREGRPSVIKLNYTVFRFVIGRVLAAYVSRRKNEANTFPFERCLDPCCLNVVYNGLWVFLCGQGVRASAT